ncbi:hypothetical protein BDZ90DRAFT_230151 [Jaminaea rosea]|uniref:Uncharacterized protein n=1 Tax=Jaminaea rosea TaxID=1569628 RepID=A0A316V2C8_9BASI|nr:hypothetical protein BDZ90DRAFT_230151 [Jaminaea rosea]PWN31158.1 hypothetical protein BDZ90DRAFT_230151 [Jaminaea rosea]
MDGWIDGKSKRDVFFVMVMKTVLDTPGAGRDALANVLGAKYHTANSFYGQINTAVCALIEHFHLQHRAESRISYGRPELELLQQQLIADLGASHMSPRNFENTTSALSGTSLGYVTGLRGGSMAASDPLDSDRQGLNAKDITLKRHLFAGASKIEDCPFALDLELTVRRFKGFQRADNRHETIIRIPAVERVENVNIEPQVFIATHLMAEGRLKERDEPDRQGTVIRTMSELLSSPAYEFVGFDCAAESAFLPPQLIETREGHRARLRRNNQQIQRFGRQQGTRASRRRSLTYNAAPESTRNIVIVSLTAQKQSSSNTSI